MFNSPIFVIIEEAHVFIPKGEDARAKYWATKIAREGRKFGLGLGIVSQRPRNIEPSILSQMGSLAVMKMKFKKMTNIRLHRHLNQLVEI